MNSKQKGSRGERECRDVWKKHGYEDAHRSQQFSGRGESSADLEGIDPRLHIEVKRGYSYKTIYTFLEQAIQDAKQDEIPIVNCKMDRHEWLCVMRLDDFIEIWQNQAETIPIIPTELKKDFHIDEVDENRRSIFEDIVYVVRCKDCRHHGMRNCPVWGDDTTEDYMWCYYGERREDGTISNT